MRDPILGDEVVERVVRDDVTEFVVLGQQLVNLGAVGWLIDLVCAVELLHEVHDP